MRVRLSFRIRKSRATAMRPINPPNIPRPHAGRTRKASNRRPATIAERLFFTHLCAPKRKHMRARLSFHIRKSRAPAMRPINPPNIPRPPRRADAQGLKPAPRISAPRTSAQSPTKPTADIFRHIRAKPPPPSPGRPRETRQKKGAQTACAPFGFQRLKIFPA